MPIGISDDTRNQVIREWLAGEPRDKSLAIQNYLLVQ
jgi:hypothetical protein